MARRQDMVKFHTFEQFHNKKGIGSTNIRVANLIKHWPESSLYQYGNKPDVLIFQKVYCTKDYKFPATYSGKKILDICDPDWLEGALIKETVDSMDAVVCPTEALADFIRQLTNKPVRVIKDRFAIEELPTRKKHKDDAKTVVWFGYHHNSSALKLAVPSLEKRNLNLIVVSNQDPFAYRWATNSIDYEKKYTFIKYDEKAYENIQLADICVLPKLNRPKDRFKSENRTVLAQLLGLPVAKDAIELDNFLTAEARNRHIDTIYDKLKQEYDCRLSVKEYKELIDEIKRS